MHGESMRCRAEAHRYSMKRHLVALLTSVATTALVHGACAPAKDASPLKELQRTRAGAVEIVLLSADDTLRQGKASFAVEFRSASDQRLVDVSDVKVNATMPMAGMAPMIGDVTARRTDVAGRYAVDSNFNMVGSWRVGLEWDGPAGKGLANLQGRVQ